VTEGRAGETVATEAGPSRPEQTWANRARAASLEDLANGRFDVLIVGGGIVGAGAMLDAASRGLRVALVEQEDIA
jgi:NADPH-dependent 2,4-dienoyl-CoA reductase/sulfur reductase-like enzyme